MPEGCAPSFRGQECASGCAAPESPNGSLSASSFELDPFVNERLVGPFGLKPMTSEPVVLSAGSSGP